MAAIVHSQGSRSPGVAPRNPGVMMTWQDVRHGQSASQRPKDPSGFDEHSRCTSSPGGRLLGRGHGSKVVRRKSFSRNTCRNTNLFKWHSPESLLEDLTMEWTTRARGETALGAWMSSRLKFQQRRVIFGVVMDVVDAAQWGHI